LNFGPFELHVIETGRFRLDGGAMFGVVPKNLWSKTNPADGQNRIAMTMRSLLIKNGEQVLLVDTGVGYKTSEKFNSIFAIDFSACSLEMNLRKAGVEKDDVTHVVCTHLHFDHIGGATTRIGNDITATFQNAQYLIQRKHWEWALKPSVRDTASFLPENYLPLREREQITLLDGDTELFPGIAVEVINGHTFGQQLVRVAHGGRTIIFVADLVPLAAHIPAPYIMGYDLQPLVSLQEKTSLLSEVVMNDDILFFEHDRDIEAATVEQTPRGFSMKKGGSLEEILASCS